MTDPPLPIRPAHLDTILGRGRTVWLTVADPTGHRRGIWLALNAFTGRLGGVLHSIATHHGLPLTDDHHGHGPVGHLVFPLHIVVGVADADGNTLAGLDLTATERAAVARFNQTHDTQGATRPPATATPSASSTTPTTAAAHSAKPAAAAETTADAATATAIRDQIRAAARDQVLVHVYRRTGATITGLPSLSADEQSVIVATDTSTTTLLSIGSVLRVEPVERATTARHRIPDTPAALIDTSPAQQPSLHSLIEQLTNTPPLSTNSGPSQPIATASLADTATAPPAIRDRNAPAGIDKRLTGANVTLPTSGPAKDDYLDAVRARHDLARTLSSDPAAETATLRMALAVALNDVARLHDLARRDSTTA